MKRIYKKPEIMFEDFSLNINIAAACEYEANNNSKNSCGFALEGFDDKTLFLDVGVCTYLVTDGEYNGICYHNPSSTSNVFGS